MKGLKPIRISKNLIQEPIHFERELGIRFFKDCIFKFNQIEDLDKEIFFSFEELRKGYQLKKTEDFRDFMSFFHNEINSRKELFLTEKGNIIGGGVFSSKLYFDEKKVGVVINHYFKQHIYSKLDISNWHLAKGKHKNIRTLEIEEVEKEKLLNLMTSFITPEIKGKYSQRLLDLLMQFKGSGLFVMDYEKLKNILEIPQSYKSSDIDKQILNKARKEFKKIGLIITDIEKIKEGRSIKTIKIKFYLEEKKIKADKKKTTKEKLADKEIKKVEENKKKASKSKDFRKDILGKIEEEMISGTLTEKILEDANAILKIKKLKPIPYTSTDEGIQFQLDFDRMNYKVE